MKNKAIELIDELVIKNDTTMLTMLLLNKEMYANTVLNKDIDKHESTIANPDSAEHEVKLATIKLKNAKELKEKTKGKTEREMFFDRGLPSNAFISFLKELNDEEYEKVVEIVETYKDMARIRFFVDCDYAIPEKCLNDIAFLSSLNKEEFIAFNGYTALLEDNNYNEVQLYKFILAMNNLNPQMPFITIPVKNGSVRVSYEELNKSIKEELYSDSSVYRPLHYLIVNKMTPDSGIFSYKRSLYFLNSNELKEMKMSSSIDPLTQILTETDLTEGIKAFEKMKNDYAELYCEKEVYVLVEKHFNWVNDNDFSENFKDYLDLSRFVSEVNENITDSAFQAHNIYNIKGLTEKQATLFFEKAKEHLNEILIKNIFVKKTMSVEPRYFGLMLFNTVAQNVEIKSTFEGLVEQGFDKELLTKYYDKCGVEGFRGTEYCFNLED
jgi:hypothetical protein